MEESGPKNGARNEEQEREQESLGGIQKDDQAGRHLAGHRGPFPEQLWTK